MRWLLRSASFVFLAIGIYPQAHAEAPPAPVPLKSTKLSDNIYMLEGRGGNVGVLVGATGLLMIDDQFVEQLPMVRAALKELSKNKLVYVLNTHHHRDHTGGNADLGKDATIVAHDNVRTRLVSEGKPIEALPVITFSDHLTLHFQGTEVRAIHLPESHTDGDLVVYFPAQKVLHTGDLYFYDRFPFVDLESGGDALKLTASVDRLLGMIPEDCKIIPGHGQAATAADLRRYRDMLKKTTALVRAARQKKMSLGAMKKAGLGAEWQSWGEGFIKTDKWIETVWTSLDQAYSRNRAGPLH